jgi:hypothetical protein
MGQKLVSRATYWRRRAVVLTAAVAVLGLPIWAVNQALGGSKAPGHGSPRSYSGDVAGPGRHAGGEHGKAPTRETADLSSPPRSRPTVAPPGAATTPLPGGQTCTGKSVLLTIRPDRHRYVPGEQVIFTVGAVSTRDRPCRLDLGSKFTSVVVASSGTPLWDSSSCLRGSGLWVVTLRRASPASLRITWDQRTSMSGCPGKGTVVRSGTYTAAAFNGQIHSQATAFVLSGRGAAKR